MRLRPHGDVKTFFCRHQTIRSSFARLNGVGSLCFGILEPRAVAVPDILGLIRRVVSRAEINWEAVLTILTAMLVTTPESGASLNDLINKLILEGLQSQSSQLFLSG